MKFEHVNFNEKHWKGKSLGEFMKHESHHGLGDKKMKEAFGLINPERIVEKPKEEKEVEKP